MNCWRSGACAKETIANKKMKRVESLSLIKPTLVAGKDTRKSKLVNCFLNSSRCLPAFCVVPQWSVVFVLIGVNSWIVLMNLDERSTNQHEFNKLSACPQAWHLCGKNVHEPLNRREHR